MKSYNEMAKSALLRIEEENKNILKRKKALKRTLIPALSLCLAVAVSFAVKDVWNNKSGVEIEEEEYVLYEYENAIDTDGNNMTGIKTEATTGNSAKPDNSNGSPAMQNSAPQDSGETTVGSPCIRVVSIMYEGKNFVYYESKDMALYEKDKFLGGVSTFVGYYKPEYIDGKVYSVKNSSEFLLIELDDGKTVLLKEIE